jgi:hypothetical protein
MPVKSLLNKRFGYLQVIDRGPNTHAGSAQWWCHCDCNGPLKLIDGHGLRNGSVVSCGCRKRELMAKVGRANTGKLGRYVDLTNARFGYLTVLRRAPISKQHSARWICLCAACGKEANIRGDNLQKGQKSCGCQQHANSGGKYIHGGANEYPHEYNTWQTMIRRCYDHKHISYPRYGKVGITVCDRWRFGEDEKHPFTCFLEDMGRRTAGKTSIDRIDSSKDYTPDNCRWATALEQGQNRRRKK